MSVCLLLALALQDRDAVSHQFVYLADKPQTSVFLAGTFNNWSNGANPMKLDADGRTWRLTLSLNPGKHLYKFVLDGKDWITDPKAVRNEDDGNGNVNSVLLVNPKDYSSPAAKGDGKLTLSALRHDQEPPYFNFDRGRLQLTLRMRPGDIQNASVVVGGQEWPLAFLHRDDYYETLRASVDWNRKSALRYTFKLRDGAAVRYFGPRGLTSEAKGNEYVLDPKRFRPFTVPTWVEGTVFYQIFPDRFANGDPRNDPKDVVPWNTKPTGDTRFGGDTAGVAKHIDYLKALGVGAIYFNPVFAAPVIHRYETTDYKQIDAQFGTEKEFAELTRKLEANGIRTVLDGVFNHTAPDFFAFKDLLANQERSKYRDWYFVKRYPVKVEDNPNYVGWWGIKSMPKLNVLNPEVRAYLLSVPQYWAKHARIHGWRLDAANEVDSQFWRSFRNTVKATDPNAWIVGEVWGDGTPWLKGDQWDSIMGYQFRDAAIRFVAEGSTKPSQFIGQLMKVYESYAPQVSRNLMNLLSSHDTARFLTLCKGDKKLAMLAAAIQLTWVGTPCVYYGEEIGMEGDHDPGCRAGMEWQNATAANPMLSHYRKLISARNASPALRTGVPLPLTIDDRNGTFSYARIEGKEAAFVVVNRSNRAQTVGVGTRAAGKTAGTYRDVLSGKTYRLRADNLMISLDPVSACVLVPVSSDGANADRSPSSRSRSNQ